LSSLISTRSLPAGYFWRLRCFPFHVLELIFRFVKTPRPTWNSVLREGFSPNGPMPSIWNAFFFSFLSSFPRAPPDIHFLNITWDVLFLFFVSGLQQRAGYCLTIYPPSLSFGDPCRPMRLLCVGRRFTSAFPFSLGVSTCFDLSTLGLDPGPLFSLTIQALVR